MSNEELVIRIQKGDTGAKNELWECIKKLVYVFCEPYREYAAEKYLEMDDLLNAAWFGVERAIMAYESEKGYQFNTYLKYYVMNTAQELLGLRGKKQLDTVSLDEPLDEDGDICRLDVIEDEAAEAAFDEVDEAAGARWLWGRVERLPERERDAILAYYRDNISLSEQGRRNGCSYQAMAERKNSGLNMLRKDMELKRYYNEFAYATLNVSIGTFKQTWTSSTEWAVLKMEQERCKDAKRHAKHKKP